MFSDPNAIVAQLPITEGMLVADLGAGTGTFSFLAAHKVGTTGKVYACEVQKDMLTRIINEAHERGINNIQTVHSNVEVLQGTKLRDSSIDWVLVVNLLFQIEHRDSFVKEIYRIVKPGGAVLVVDWTESFGNLGPHVKDVVSQKEAIALFESIRFKKTPQVIEAGAHHYGITLRK